MQNKYLFQSPRLGFRTWTNNDLPDLIMMNSDPVVMEYFPKTLDEKECADLLLRLQMQYDKNGYTYYATELLETGEFLGFIGLAYQEYKSEFTPATDIGWRLKKSAWGKGYATEGALQCLEYAFQNLKLERIMSTCPIANIKSEQVMKKIGMEKKGEFDHPGLSEYPYIEKCVWYEIENS